MKNRKLVSCNRFTRVAVLLICKFLQIKRFHLQVWQYELLGIRTCLGDKVGEFKNRCQSGVAGSILAISCCGGSLFIYPKFSSRSLYQRFMEEITGDDLQIEALPVGSIASDSAVTALLYWQGKLFVGCADRIIKVYSGQ
ncbi:uncharacterized protein LOC117921066 isoform X3 [Vitis riparia]|uniref:uncharacterized protein LOC117921066 isoform X3 n=1 Tax=Vitis riparia TaxID=96939 RepID=UPI00155ACE21|nr:uncharacterized protein LOC117921066 isoform X3 [Vitis riparia]